MRFGILGPLEVADGQGRQLALGGRQQRAVLAVLLLHANEVVSSDRLVEELWGGEPPASAAKSVQIHVSRLRRALGEVACGEREERIVTAAGGYLIRVAAGELDRESFERRIEEASAAIATELWELAAAKLREALGLWRGGPLGDFEYDSFAQREISRLVELHVGAVERQIEVELALGREAQVIGDLDRLVRVHPYRERLRGQLMLALYRVGRQAEALGAYRDARAALVDELGIEPSAELRELHQAILAQDSTLMLPAPARAAPKSLGVDGAGEGVVPAPSSASIWLTNLPPQGRGLVGRDRDRAALSELLRGDDGQIVTVTGIGGIGKTRLAIAVGRELLDRFPGGVFLIRLAGVRDPASLVPMIAEAVGVTGESDVPLLRVLAQRLGEQPTLIILDNFEQLVSGSMILTELLAFGGGLRLLVTSQIPLRVAAERTVPLGPLAPADAVELFIERARTVIPEFVPADDDRAAIGDICARLDRMPLAIELAAARIGVFGLRELERRLERPLDLLTRGKRDAPERQRSLRATFEWTHALLNSGEQSLLARLGVCAGAVPLAAVEAIAGPGASPETLDRLDGLLEFSFVRRQQDHRLSTRFRVPQALREFALERLVEAGDEQHVRRLHAEHVAKLARDARLWKWGATAEQRSSLLAVLDEIRPAVAWAREHDHELHVRICANLSSYWVYSGVLSEVADELRRARESAAGSAADRAWTLTLLAKCTQLKGTGGNASQLADEVLAEWRSVDDEHERALALGPVSWVLMWASRYDEGIALSQEALATLRRSSDRLLILRGLVFLAHALADREDLTATETVLREADELAAGDPVWELAAIHGDCAALRGDNAAAVKLYAESLSWTSTTGESHQMLMDLRCLVMNLPRLGNGEAALEVHELLRLEEQKTGRVGLMPIWAQTLSEAVSTAHDLVSPRDAQRAALRARKVPSTARARRAIDLATQAVARHQVAARRSKTSARLQR